KDHPKGKDFARHVAKGGALYEICEAAQRGPGLPVSKLAAHSVASRGGNQVYKTVQTFQGLVAGGHKPHFWGLSSITHAISHVASKVGNAVSSTVSKASSAVSSFANKAQDTVKSGISSMAHGAGNVFHALASPVKAVVQRAAGAVKGVAHGVSTFVTKTAHQARH